MTKNILDAISNDEEATLKSSFVVVEKINKEIIQVEKIADELENDKTDKQDKILTPGIFPNSLIPDSEEAISLQKGTGDNTDLKPKKIKRPSEQDSTRPEKRRKKEEDKNIEISIAPEPLWLSVSEAAKTGGVEQKTIRRAIQSENVKFKIIKNRYLLEFASLVKYLSSNKKLRNKFLTHGIGQYVDRWK